MCTRKLFLAPVFALICAAVPVKADAQDVTTAMIDAGANRSTFWIGGERLSLGIGQRHDTRPAFAAPDGSRTLGLGLKLSPSTTFTFESDTRALRSHGAWLGSDQHRIGLSMRPTSRSRDVQSLMTVQLSGQSVLQLRPRGGGLRVTYRTTF